MSNLNKLPPKLFIDSGAFSLYIKNAFGKDRAIKFGYYETKEFWEYVDSYIDFIKQYGNYIDYYATIDVLHNPKLTQKVHRYLEDKGLRPIPIIHCGCDLKWLEYYLEKGYDFIGLGGIAVDGNRLSYFSWADNVFSKLCPGPTYLPIIKTHGFAMTAYDIIIRYPWYSVDSASWAKSAAFGSIYVPHKNKGRFHFDTSPYVLCVSHHSPSAKKTGKLIGQHYRTMPLDVQAITREWLEYINIPLGSVDKDGNTIEEGVINHYGSRGIANMRFFDLMCKSLPKWPWPFRPNKSNMRGFGI